MSKTQIEDLPNEILFHLFSYLQIEDIIRCSQLCKRIRNICQDESFWEKVNIRFKKVPIEFLQQTLINGCKHLSLSSAEVKGSLELTEASNLSYLRLTNCFVSMNFIMSLLGSCHLLNKLSLYNRKINNEIFKLISLQNYRTLQVLDLNDCKGLDLLSIKHIIDNCLELTELNLMRTNLPGKTINYLANNLTPNITKLNLGRTYTHDNDVEILVSRCNKLVELELSRTYITGDSVNSISVHLKSSLEFLNISYTFISYPELLPLGSMLRLTFLNYDLPSTNEKDFLNEHFPSLSINEKFGHIASPDETFNPQDGLWEIKMNQIQLFQDTQLKTKSSKITSMSKMSEKEQKITNFFF